MNADLRIIIIKQNGNMVVIFSCENNECDNVIETDNVEEIKNYYDQIKDKVYKKKDSKDKHLFYLKDYLKNNFVEEFSSIGINPQNSDDDVLLYFLLSEFGNVILINSSEHVNLAIAPNVGLNNEQLSCIKNVDSLFDASTMWQIEDNMHFEIIEENGKKYKVLDYGDTVEGNLGYFEEIADKRVKKQ